MQWWGGGDGGGASGAAYLRWFVEVRWGWRGVLKSDDGRRGYRNVRVRDGGGDALGGGGKY